MRIDRARAAETIDAIARIGHTDDGAEVGLVQFVTAQLEQSGWDVENREVVGSASAAGVRRWLASLTAGLAIVVAFLLARGGFSALWSFLGCGLAVAGWLWLVRYSPRTPWALPPLRSGRLLISRNRSSSQGLPRVVIRVSLGSAGRSDPGQRDGAGIALLLELARGWAASHTKRVETVLAFAGGQSLDQAGDRGLAELLTKEWPRKPTLLITLDSPGAGKELLIHENGRFVIDAAESLWVPYRLAASREYHRVPFLSIRAAESEVWIGGSANIARPEAVDLEALARAAQLVEEVVLRWGKRHSRLSDQRADDRNASKSLQNPG